MNTIKVVDERNFEMEVTRSGKPVLVDFWAEWCDPCDLISPELDRIAERYGEELQVVKCHVGDNDELAMQYGVMAIPMLVLFKEGNIVGRLAGYMNAAELSARIGSMLSMSKGKGGNPNAN